jgi:hypothetical protein
MVKSPLAAAAESGGRMIAGAVHIDASGHWPSPSRPQTITKAAVDWLRWRAFVTGRDRRLSRANRPPLSRSRQDARNLMVQLVDADFTMTGYGGDSGDATLGDYTDHSKIGYGAMLKARGRLTLCRMFVDVARETHREYMPKLAFGSRLETLVVGVCVAIGHLEGKPFSAAKLAAYLDCPRTSVIRRLDALAKMQIIVRRGTRYYLNEPRVNSDSAIKSHDRIRRIVLKAAEQLSETDTLGS